MTLVDDFRDPNAPPARGGSEATLSLAGISKSFPGVQALAGVDLDLYAGECHALLGQNGAGKSTLVKIVSGAQRASTGTMRLNGVAVDHHSPAQAQAAGIYTIYQEMSLIHGLSVAENVYLSDLPRRRGLVDWAAARRAAREMLLSIGFDIDVSTPVRSLSVAERQAVEIAKALHHNAKVLLLDEPTATLPAPDVEKLFGVLRQLKSSGVSVLYISHRLEEVYEICERMTILRDGRHVTTQPTAAITPDDAVRYMVGERFTEGLVGQLGAGGQRRLNTRPVDDSAVPALDVRGLSDEGILRDISLTVRPGEVVSVAGLVGSGQSELAACLFGARRRSDGRIFVCGEERSVRSPQAAARAGLGLVPEERKTQGLVLGMPLSANITMANIGRVSRAGILRRRAENALAVRMAESLGLSATGVDQRAGTLSGGNQQKVVFAKWLVADAKVMVLSEPTRGIDVAAKEEIYRSVRTFLEGGGAALVISSELDEALMCDRIYVLARGRIVGEFDHDGLDHNRLVSLLR
jgi:ribose transport system ATP-binding protein